MKTSDKLPPKGRTKLSRHFRKNMTDAEAVLWSQLRNRGYGVKFRRQVPVGNYIVDFLSVEIKMIIEVDGSQHGEKETFEKDQVRDRWLQDQGYTVLRIWSQHLLTARDETLGFIFDEIEKLKAVKK